MYGKNPCKYQVPYYKGRNIKCKHCAAKEAFTGSIVCIDPESNKFIVKKVEPTLLTYLKLLIK
jgi:hypothetical protein